MAVVQLGMVNENGRERRVFKRRGRAGLMSVKGIKASLLGHSSTVVDNEVRAVVRFH